ncbi:MAG: hypothetical protein L3J25_11095 [Flavobacteriaceae bacterium]|nr:hypothetical protein [Flavobacteriaceae bacterium]
MKAKIKILFFIILSLGIITTIIFFINNYESPNDFYPNAVNKSFARSYEGVVIKKFISGARKKIVLNDSSFKEEIDFIYEKFDIYEFIQLGDTLLKEKNSLNLQIKRRSFDTIIQLKFENIKGSENYESPLELLDSLK